MPKRREFTTLAYNLDKIPRSFTPTAHITDIDAQMRRGGQSTQLHYLSESTDTTGQILLHYK